MSVCELELQAKQDLALKQGNDYYDYITGEVKSNVTTAAFLPNTSKAPSNTERLVEPTSFRIISAF
jgi:hypothetical protein